MVNHSCPFKNCTSTFDRPYRLKIHLQRHQGIKEFQCTLCDRSYHRRQHLQRHVAEIHEKQPRLEQPLSCDHCDRNFTTVWGLRRHQIKIKENKAPLRQHQCEVCKRKFYSENFLKQHLLKHERFKCNIPSCPLLAHSFHWQFYNKHMTDYHSEPFDCEHCDKRFLYKSQIRQHVQLHMPDLICTQPNCNKRFVFAKNLDQHILVVHQNKKMFKCHVTGCDWEFKYKSCLKRHIEVHQKNGKIIPMVNRLQKKKKEKKLKMAKKLAGLSLIVK